LTPLVIDAEKDIRQACKSQKYHPTLGQLTVSEGCFTDTDTDSLFGTEKQK